METLPESIHNCLQDHHVVGLATCVNGQIWAASCFYAFDAPRASLILLTSRETCHGLAMLANPRIAGTIAGQPESVLQIHGVQFRGCATLLDGEAATQAYQLYCRRHPVAKLKQSDIWQITLDEIKHTNNALIFGRKTCWQRDA